MMRTNFRDHSGWKDFGIIMSTSSNEACKLFDAALTQYVGWYEDDTFGGLDKTLEKLKTADPDFVMGHVLSNGLTLLSTGDCARLNKKLEEDLNTMFNICDSQDAALTEREKSHVEALKYWSEGKMVKATKVWEDILCKHNDMLAVKFAHDTYFYLGQQAQMRDSISRVLPIWKTNEPLYSYLHGMLSFGLVETNFYDKAEKEARKGLELNKNDAWSTHALAHVLEMGCRPDEGIAFMSKTVQDWEPCGLLACHNFWHWAIYHIEKGEVQAALDLYDIEIGKRAKSEAMLDFVDAASLLYRLEFEGVHTAGRWNKLYELCKKHLNDHILAFNDAHFLMACLGSKKEAGISNLMDSLKEYMETESGDNSRVARKVGYQLMQAMIEFDNKNYESAINHLLPIRYDLTEIGGSNAQRDVFALLLLNAALSSPNSFHQHLARSLLLERNLMRDNSPMTVRLARRLV